MLKFGGDAMGTPHRLARVVDRVDRDHPCAAVVSAASGVTDRLETLADQDACTHQAAQAAIERLASRHQALSEGVPSEPAGAAGRRLEEQLERLRDRLLSCPAEDGEATRRAEILATGERLAATVLEARLAARGIEARVVDPKQAGLRTTEEPRQARIRLQPTRVNVRRTLGRLLDAGVLPVVPGFFGYDEQGRARLLGRDGTDYTAAAVAYGLEADEVVLHKDVGAIHTADPRRCPGARRVREASYTQIELAARHGARIVHPGAIEPLRAAEIPLRIRALADDGDGQEGTVVHADPDPELTDVVIAHEAGGGPSTVTVIHPRPAGDPEQPGAWLEHLHRALVETPDPDGRASASASPGGAVRPEARRSSPSGGPST